MKHLTLVVLATLLAQGSAISAEVYTWKDKNGRVHYSDQPNADPNAKSITTTESSGGVGLTSKQTAESARALNEQQAKRGDAEKTASEEAARKAARDAACNSLKDRIALFEQGGRIVTNKGGEREYLSDEQIASELSKMKGQQSKDCK
ncbi:DUF4124 domain-containing protein [Niveibacterium sp. 24ML]|uniref:DUF4124 domain-containing protein n=1 Tax=Niveibacterium sp. 24ML TaxID=2985512 RepID=UPI002271A8D4|nr:DUF4124 domain-containing protein [Niveibacterium sp. 24ML]MCX9156722.1 DUF4124 domain-containing protein [Niveibacterium sp. 24ML]